MECGWKVLQLRRGDLLELEEIKHSHDAHKKAQKSNLNCIWPIIHCHRTGQPFRSRRWSRLSSESWTRTLGEMKETHTETRRWRLRIRPLTFFLWGQSADNYASIIKKPGQYMVLWYTKLWLCCIELYCFKTEMQNNKWYKVYDFCSFWPGQCMLLVTGKTRAPRSGLCRGRRKCKFHTDIRH